MASDYPLLMRLVGRCCVVVGAGPVGLRKVDSLVKAGADVVLIDPRPLAETISAAVAFQQRTFREDDLDGAFLVFAATDDSQVNRAIAEAARDREIPVNIADAPADSDFIVPASFNRGDLVVSVASGGASPAVSAMVRDEIEKSLPGEWATFLGIAANLRSRLLTSERKSAYNQRVLRKLVSNGILALLADSDGPAIDRLLEAEFGKGYSLADLGISLSKGSS